MSLAHPHTSHLHQVRAATEQLHSLASATDEADRQAQLGLIDWALVSSEFDSVVAHHESALARCAVSVIQELQAMSIRCQKSIQLEQVMADLETYVVDAEPGDADREIAAVWADLEDERAIDCRLILPLPPMTSLSVLRSAVDERLEVHRRLHSASHAYREGWPVPLDQLDNMLLVARLSREQVEEELMYTCDHYWNGTTGVLLRVLRSYLIRSPGIELAAELASAIPMAVAAGIVEVRIAPYAATSTGPDTWRRSEIRLASAYVQSPDDDVVML